MGNLQVGVMRTVKGPDLTLCGAGACANDGAQQCLQEYKEIKQRSMKNLSFEIVRTIKVVKVMYQETAPLEDMKGKFEVQTISLQRVMMDSMLG